jgi:hypothetical protein
MALERARFMQFRDPPRWELPKIAQIPREVKEEAALAIVGDSRAQQLSGRWALRKWWRQDGQAIVDLSLPGGSFIESLDILDRELSALPNVQCLLFCFPFGVRTNMTYRRTPEVYRVVDHPVLYLLHWETVLESLRLLSWQRRPAVEGPADTAAVLPEFDYDRTLALSRIAGELYRLVAAGRQRGIRVAFYLPPLEPRLADYVRQNRWAEFEEFRQRLAELGPVIDVCLPPAGTPRFTFPDGIHVREHELLWQIVYQELTRCLRGSRREVVDGNRS